MGCMFGCCWRNNYGEPVGLNRVAGDNLYLDISEEQWPIVYSPHYNISFCGLENLHPFDSKKWGRVYEMLERHGMVTRATIVEPNEAQIEDLLRVHTVQYINSLNSSCIVAGITEVPPVACLCPCTIEKHILRPFRYHTGGTILAGKLAMERGWAINIGGGFHHCSSNNGGGFCMFADITLVIRFLFDMVSTVRKAMIVDLDAHQGNGHERDFTGDDRVYIMDAYNSRIYPRDIVAKRGIRKDVPLNPYMQDVEYIPLIRRHLEEALQEFQPDIIVYNAGTDILDGDGLGLLSITEEGIINRDETVFRIVRRNNIPIVMLTSGGYQRVTAGVIARSIINLHNKGLISLHKSEM